MNHDQISFELFESSMLLPFKLVIFSECGATSLCTSAILSVNPSTSKLRSNQEGKLVRSTVNLRSLVYTISMITSHGSIIHLIECESA